MGSGGENKLSAKKILTTSIAGGASGALEILFTYPFEFAKTQMQLQPKLYGKMNTFQCWSHTYNQFNGFPRGLTALYRGMPPLIAFGIPRNASRFTGFEVAQDKFKQWFPTLHIVPLRMAAGFVGGFSEAVLVTTYQETMKVRLIHDRLSDNPRFRNTIHGISTIFKEQGVRGIYKGLGATILKQGTNQMIRFPTYYYLKTFMLGSASRDFSENGPILGNLQNMACGGLAGAASVLGNTPIDVIKTKMQGFDSHLYKGFGDCVKQTWQNEGFKGFYKGMGARMGRVSADVALTFFFMEKVKQLIKSLID